ncbi:hypothetical protein GPK34_00005 [Secundilactobacillus kimchicus]|uniref:hypothetical protein n=1 Tax=Secundilactobacillus kimchicus TaxID=528209 RepID=UPI001C027906|nr:hypothetical protein [Secundilactobacillus kimchicus]MBT9670418.1 hypothetical protein [Secundilactobacillus kimchicus]
MNQEVISLEDLMAIDVSNIAKTQFEEYKKFILHRLDEVRLAIKNDNFEWVKSVMGGDVYDHRFIDFKYSTKQEAEQVDLAMALDILYNLKANQEEFDNED